MQSDTMQTLTCKACDATWERVPQRGRPPTTCDDCKGKPKPKAKVVEKPKPVKVEAKPEPMDFESDGDKMVWHTMDSDTYERQSEEPDLGNTELDRESEYEYSEVAGWRRFGVFYIGGKVVKLGDHLRIKNERGVYKFNGYVIQEKNNDLPFIDLLGETGTYKGKYRAAEPGKVKRA